MARAYRGPGGAREHGLEQQYAGPGRINRHFGAVELPVRGWLRAEGGLKELWTLKWHRSFETAGPWTKAGGVQAENWPEWLRPFKEY